MKGLFNKVKNLPTRQRYVVSTVRKGDCEFETAVFEANFFYLPRKWSQPQITVATATVEQAWDIHHLLASRLSKEYPLHIFQEYS